MGGRKQLKRRLTAVGFAALHLHDPQVCVCLVCVVGGLGGVEGKGVGGGVRRGKGGGQQLLCAAQHLLHDPQVCVVWTACWMGWGLRGSLALVLKV